MLCQSTTGQSESGRSNVKYEIEAVLKELKTSIKDDIRSEFQAELRILRDEKLGLSSNYNAELINQQQLQIQALKEELLNLDFRIRALEEEKYYPRNLLKETNCTSVKECVAEELDEINVKLISEEMRINQIVGIDLLELHDEIEKVIIGFSANDTQLENLIDDEIEERKQNDGKLQTNIETETEERGQKDGDLQESITAEANARTKQDNVLQSDIDAIYGKPGFIVTATKTGDSENNIPKDVIKFNDKIIDHSNSFNVDTGIFKVPVAGNYLFIFDCDADFTFYSGVHVYVNGNVVYYSYETNGDSDLQQHHLNFMFSSKLEEGDELWLYNDYSDTIRSSYYHPITFVGYKTF